MIKKHPVSTGIIAALLLSNGVVAWQYSKDINEYDQKLETKTEQFDQLKINYTNNIELLNKKEDEIKSNIETINGLKTKNESLNETVSKQKEDIVKLKEQLEQTKQRNRELP
ncbi:hypothetical protein [Metabacillus sp. Hm71]|uniref:hypothetical protein n=1 Tax=Metabacillus sp. Hm71 TaxID=3450743 RepID=UPI003F43EFF9